MKLRNHVVLGAVGALMLIGSAVAVTGGRQISLQGTFLQSGSGATLRTIESKERDFVSVKDFGAEGDGTTDDTTAIQAAITAVGASGGTVWIPPGVYVVSAMLTTPAGWFKIKGAGMDPAGTVLAFTNAGDGLQIGGNWTVEDLTISTNNAAAGIGLRWSGFQQTMRNVQIARTGSGLWARGMQALGIVTGMLDTGYINVNAATIGLDVIPNGVNAVGAFTVLNAEIRAVTTGIHVGGNPGALSMSMFGGTVEGAGSAGILVDGAGAPSLAIYGTHFESNTTDDIKWTTGGDLSIFEANFVAGTTNAINCPDTTCTARVRGYGVIGNATAHVILGNAVASSSLFGCKLAGSLITLGKPGNVARWANSSLDGTAISNTVADDGGGPGRMFLQGGAGTNQAQISSNTDGKLYALHNGIQGWIIDANGKFQIVTGVLPDGGGVKHKRVAGCATAASLAATCTTSVAWTSNFADTSYSVVCMGDLLTSGVPLNGGITAKAVGSVTFQTVSATAAAAQYTTIDCWAAHD